MPYESHFLGGTYFHNTRLPKLLAAILGTIVTTNALKTLWGLEKFI